MKVPIKKAATKAVGNVCDNCAYQDPGKMEGATNVMCFRYPRRELMRVTDWCGEHKALIDLPTFTGSVKG